MKNIAIILLVICGMWSCSPKYYTPNTQNVPLISEKGETNLTVSGNENQVEFQGSYGISNIIAIQANGGLFIPKNLEDGNGGSGKFIELGAGYFHKIKENWVFELYGIAGIGSFENHLPTTVPSNPKTSGDISANIFRLGIQPNFGYKSKYFSAALSSRFVNLSYSKIDGDLIYNSENQVNYLTSNSSNFLIEPALTLRGGVEKVKLQLQFGVSYNVSNPDFRQDYTFITAGLNFNLKQ